MRLSIDARSFQPQFSYKGFRYVELRSAWLHCGLQVTGLLAHADLEVASMLTSSDEYLERFDAAMRASLANNMHHVPTDTPMHEKNGWTGTRWVCVRSRRASTCAGCCASGSRIRWTVSGPTARCR